jgi:hypothetical protein
MAPARTQAIIWPLAYAWEEACHSDGGNADPGPIGCDAIKPS